MPRPFQQLTIEQFSHLVQQFPFRRQIDSVHMHHTWRPNHAMYKGIASIEAMYQFHTVTNGWSDIAQHVTIAPDGTLWTGRNWNDPPASATGFNGNREHGPFMFEMLGDFDTGKDPFQAPQRDTAIGVIAFLQEQFKLPVEALRFHNQMTSLKTCPGNTIRRDDIVEAVREKRSAIAAAPVGRGFDAGQAFESFRSLVGSGVRQEELLAETADDAMPGAEERFYSGDAGYVQWPAGSRGAARGLSSADISGLRPYVISMRQGQWDTSGIFNSTPGEVQALFFEHAKAALEALPRDKKLKFVLYAHGGLVSEQHGLQQAQIHIDFWRQSAGEGIYPVYFIWKTGLGETIAQLLGLAHPAAKSLAAASREFITDPIVAGIARRLGGEALWSGMKRDAEQAMLPNGVAAFAAQQLKEFCDLYPNRVELHAVGHSAGAIFHSHFIPLSTVTGNPLFTTTSLMAPAVRVDTFLTGLATDQGAGHWVLKPEVGTLALFTMKRDYEKKDNCAHIYRQSLLYLIYHAFEPEGKTPLLGLEESIRADARLTSLFGLNGGAVGGAEVVWSPSLVDSGRSATRAIHHGDFSADAPTFNSILRRILALSDTDPIHAFPAQSRAFDDINDIWAPPDDLAGFGTDFGEVPATTPIPSPVPSTPTGSGGGRRRALCVGIDNYAPPNRLAGCVNDAHGWSDTLQSLGFETKMLLDESASYAGMTAAMRDLVSSSQTGDVIVFQYSGHGTTVPDETGRTVDGVEEAMVPADFSADNPVLLMDFDVAAIFNAVPQGVNLTCFIDCCHSGTITRLLIGLSPQRTTPGADERQRFITLTADELAAVRRYRSSFAATARGNTIGGPARMHDVVFSACQPTEVAWEANGHGDFTRIATALLSERATGLTNEQFASGVIQKFGADARQHPMLDCAPPARAAALLQP